MKNLLAASGLENLISLVFLVIVAIVTLFLKRKQQQEAEEDSTSESAHPHPSQTPRPRAPAQSPTTLPPKPSSWEEELRRLLEGESAESERPPVVVQPVPQPLPQTRPSALPPPIPRPQPVLARPREGEQPQGMPVRLAVLAQSAEVYQKVIQPSGQVQARLRGAEAQGVLPPPGPQVMSASPDLERARALLRSRESLRAAMVASIILGSPKGSDN